MNITLMILIVAVFSSLLVAIIVFIAIFRSDKQKKMLTKSTSSDISSTLNDESDTKCKDDIYIRIAKIKHILNQNPDDFDSREQLGDCQTTLSAYQAALTEYLAVLDRNTDITEKGKIRIMNKLAQTYISLKNYSEAQKYCRLVRQMDQQNVTANVNLAFTIIKSGDVNKGLLILKKLHQTNRGNEQIAKYMGIAHFLNSNYNPAITCFAYADKIKPLTDEALLDYGIALLRTNSPQASYYLSQAINDNNFAAEAHYYLGVYNRSQSDYFTSNQHFTAAVSSKNIKPAMFLDAYYNMGLNYVELKDVNKALKCWETVQEKKSDYKDVVQKIQVYSNRNSSDNMKLFITGTPTQFAALCKKFAANYAYNNTSLSGPDFTIDSAVNGDAGYVITGACRNGLGKESYIFLFIRETGTVGDVYIRSVYKHMVDDKIDKAICVTCGTFSDVARDFVAARMITLIDSDETNALLKKI